MRLDQALALIDRIPVDRLGSLTRHELMTIAEGMTPSEVSTFLFAKNVKIFGGINGYVADFFGKGTLEQIAAMPAGLNKEGIKQALRETLERMLTYPDLTVDNRNRIQAAIGGVLAAAAAAAGGGRRNRSRRNRSRRNRSRRSRSRRNR